jgi:predicted TPR repeat methyltransferase
VSIENANTLNIIGALAYQAQDLELAEKFIKRAITISPTNDDYYNNLAAVFFASNRLEEAANQLRHALRLQPDNAETYKNLGLTLYALGQILEAVGAYRRALTIQGDDPVLYFNIGNAFFALGRFNKAASSFKHAIALKPRFTDAHLKLGNARYMQGKLFESIESYRRALAIDPERAETYHNLGASLAVVRKTKEAVAAFQRTVDLDPLNPTARHMLAALTGKKTKSAPVEYIRRLFDRYSSIFDQHVTQILNYQVPFYLHKIVEQFSRKSYHFKNAIDLGCGTGLAGSAVRPGCERLCGVDLSSKMIDVARKKGIYDELIVDEMMHFLQNTPGTYNLIVATDVFIYFGELYDILKAIRNRSRKGTYFIFNTETATTKDFVLRKSGRYAHSPEYIQTLAGKTGFEVCILKTVALRKENGNWIKGQLYILKTQ